VPALGTFSRFKERAVSNSPEIALNYKIGRLDLGTSYPLEGSFCLRKATDSHFGFISTLLSEEQGKIYDFDIGRMSIAF
jgi:hypothetical protein